MDELAPWSPLEITPKLLQEGHLLVDLFFLGGWCSRRVVTLRFVAQRRGDWTITVDFHVDPQFLLPLHLSAGNEVLVPLFTFAKKEMPHARVHTEDEQKHGVSLPAGRESRTIAYAMLLALAHEAQIQAWATPDLLGEITDADVRTSGEAFKWLETQLQRNTSREDWVRSRSGRGTSPHNELARFVNAARLFHRSTLILAAFPRADAKNNAHKTVVFSYDAPIRISMKFPELFGYSPLRVAPLIVFGGDAASYHVQLDPPLGVVVVDTRLIYSYTDTQAWADEYDLHKDREDRELKDRSPAARALLRLGLPPYRNARGERPRPFPEHATRSGWRRWWGFIEGSAEPMPAHVHASRRRLPGLINGRDAITMFQLYPDMSAYFGLFLASCANFAYTLGLFIELRGKYKLPGWPDHPEPTFILGVLIAGFGSGLALYKSEHLITAQAARPWRWLFGIQVTALVSFLFILLISLHRSPVSQDNRLAIDAITLVATIAFVYLLAISARAWFAQTAGFRVLYGWQGFALRRRRFRFRWRPDDANTRRSSPPRRMLAPSLKEVRPSEIGHRRTVWFMTYFAECYLNEEARRNLFNRGIPASSRHDPGSRGSSQIASQPARNPTTSPLQRRDPPR